MSGGWTWAIPKNAQNANAAWDFIKMLTSKEGELEYDIKNVQIPVRTDVAKDPSYLKANPTEPVLLRPGGEHAFIGRPTPSTPRSRCCSSRRRRR